MLQQFKFKTWLKLWAYSLSDQFKLQTTSSLLLLSLIQNPQCTTHQQYNTSLKTTLFVSDKVTMQTDDSAMDTLASFIPRLCPVGERATAKKDSYLRCPVCLRTVEGVLSTTGSVTFIDRYLEGQFANTGAPCIENLQCSRWNEHFDNSSAPPVAQSRLAHSCALCWALMCIFESVLLELPSEKTLTCPLLSSMNPIIEQLIIGFVWSAFK